MSSTGSRYLLCLALSACILACFTAGCSIPDNLPFDLPGGTPQPTIVPTLEADLAVHVIDVGQGDAILVAFRDKTMLVDAGEIGTGDTVVAYLQSLNITDLDVAVATHAHSDHIGGMKDVIAAFPVGRFVDSGQPHTSRTYEDLLALIDEEGIPYTVAERGQTIALDPDLAIEILNPGPETIGDLNEDSVVLKVTYGDISYLLTGDAGTPAEESMLAAGLDLDADVLKVGHHGSRYASSEAFLAAVSPAISVISVGAGNDYGHPHAEALDRLKATGSRIYRTDEDGTVIVATDGERLAVTTGAAPATVMTVPPTTPPTPTVTVPVPVVAITDLDVLNETVTVACTEPVNLTGWTITDEGTKNTFVFPLFDLAPGEDVTVHSGIGNDTATDLYWNKTTPVWNNDGDIATLAAPNGTVIATMER
jgi:competence protein ComEC